jgi:hypothetical protein
LAAFHRSYCTLNEARDLRVAVAHLHPQGSQGLRSLQLTNREDPVTLMVAKMIFEAAKNGERDPIALRNLAVDKFSK